MSAPGTQANTSKAVEQQYSCVELTETGELRLITRPAPVLAEGEARVQVRFCSVNFTDIARVKGSYGGVSMVGAAFGGRGGGIRIPGYEPSGTVVEVGSPEDARYVGAAVLVHSHTACGHCSYCAAGIDNYCPSRRVLGAARANKGGWAEQIVVPAAQLLVLPEGVSLQAASTLEVSYATALFCLRRGLEVALTEGPIVVRGIPGMVAIAAAQYANAYGHEVVGIVRDISSPRSRLVTEKFPWLRLIDQKLAVSGGIHDESGRAAAVIVDPLGGEYIAADVSLLAPGGAVGVVGSHTAVAGEARWDQLFSKGATVYGTTRAPLEMMDEVARHIADGFVEPVIDRVFPFVRFREAIDYVEAPTGIGRTLLEMY